MCAGKLDSFGPTSYQLEQRFRGAAIEGLVVERLGYADLDLVASNLDFMNPKRFCGGPASDNAGGSVES